MRHPPENGSWADPFAALRIRRVVNCCGIYTDLGGSVLSAHIWSALQELNNFYVHMTDLLDATGEIIAELTGAEAARVTPGASAAIALAVGATMTGNSGPRSEQLPNVAGMRHEVVIAASHLTRYKYAVCARMTGAKLIPAGSADSFDLRELRAAISAHTCCVFVPAHLLDGFSGTARLAEVVNMAHESDVPVVVDAAYMCYPTQLIGRYVEAGADLVCFSAKYFSGPNSGGFVMGGRDLIRAVAALDFTRFESGLYRKFGRAFKMSRYDVAATALALAEWMQTDHHARWAEYERKANVILKSIGDAPRIRAVKRLFTMTEEVLESDTVNCLALEFLPDAGKSAAAVAQELEAGDPTIAAIVQQEVLIVAVDALLTGQEELVAKRLVAALAR